MTESDPSDTDTTDGKDYRYSTTLSAGSHEYQFTCSDGTARNITALYSGPVVTSGSAPDDDDDTTPGGGGGGTTLTKMNKLTLQPDNYVSRPGESFTGIIIITEENYLNSYEVYWYLFLLDESENQITLTSGALALQTTVTVAYKLPIATDVLPGNYRLIVRTYDGPKEHPLSNQLGMDEKWVTVEEMPPIAKFVEESTGDYTVIIFMAIMTALFAIIAFFTDRRYMFCVVAALVLFNLVLLEFVEYHNFTLPSILMIAVGMFLFTKYHIVLRIKNPHFARFVGAILIFLGFVLYVKLVVI
jgi:hypothetical protein